MHLAFDIKQSHFTIDEDGNASTRDHILDWEMRDRLGIVVNEPLGAIDAGTLILLTATAFYDLSKRRRMRPLYPDIFVFHAGGPWGIHSAFDFAPDHKEVFVDNDPAELLRCINNRGITHLVIPERERSKTSHRYKEPEAALDRIKQCFVYGRDGNVKAPSFTISVPFPVVQSTYQSMLFPAPFLTMLEETGGSPELRATNPEEIALVKAMLRSRMDEVSPTDTTFERHLRRFHAAQDEGFIKDAYRTESVVHALEMLDYR